MACIGLLIIYCIGLFIINGLNGASRKLMIPNTIFVLIENWGQTGAEQLVWLQLMRLRRLLKMHTRFGRHGNC